MDVLATSLETLVERLKERRTAGGLGLRVAAKLIGISPATLSRVERGSLPDLETFRKICRWLEIDPGMILGFRAVPERLLRPFRTCSAGEMIEFLSQFPGDTPLTVSSGGKWYGFLHDGVLTDFVARSEGRFKTLNFWLGD